MIEKLRWALACLIMTKSQYDTMIGACRLRHNLEILAGEGRKLEIRQHIPEEEKNQIIQ